MKRYKKISVDLEEKNYIDMKLFCAKNSLKMKEIINLVMEEFLKSVEQKKIPEFASWDQKEVK